MAAVVSLLEALGLVAAVVWYVLELVMGRSSSPPVALGSAALLLVFAVALVVGAKLWWAGSSSPKVPTFVWNLLLLPVAWTFLRTGEPLVGSVVGLLALAGAAASVVAAASEDEDGA